jgi:hypothetical protein
MSGHRVTRAGAILVSLCLAAWAIFLLFGAPHEPLPVQGSGIGVWWTGQPIMVAGRSVGVHGSVNAADGFLALLAYEAIGFAGQVVSLATGDILEPTVPQSYVVAGIAAVLSCAWWLACGNAVSALRLRRREQRAVRGPSHDGVTGSTDVVSRPAAATAGSGLGPVAR